MKNGYNLGLVSVSFRDRAPEEILKEMARAGLTHIEWGSDVHAPATNAARLQELAYLQQQYGITCSSYGTYFRLGKTPLSELPDYIAAAKILGTDVLRLWCGTKCGAEMTDEERSVLLSECRKAAALAAREGVTLCMECHKKSFTERVTDAVWLMEQIGSPHFLMYWQPFQWQTVRENAENAQKIAPFATHLHVFNWRGEEKLPLPDAVGDWQLYLAHFSTPRTLLLEFMPDGRLETLCREADALRAIIGG
ncbi:MAG: hypothetical protein E7624_02820 [Ruminococcaceae bacterium]|nr:hypothetical protein [Oscillospiraceae bacterium]